MYLIAGYRLCGNLVWFYATINGYRPVVAPAIFGGGASRGQMHFWEAKIKKNTKNGWFLIFWFWLFFFFWREGGSGGRAFSGKGGNPPWWRHWLRPPHQWLSNLDSTPSRRPILRCINFGIGESSSYLFLNLLNLYLVKFEARWIWNEWAFVLFYYFCKFESTSWQRKKKNVCWDPHPTLFSQWCLTSIKYFLFSSMYFAAKINPKQHINMDIIFLLNENLLPLHCETTNPKYLI